MTHVQGRIRSGDVEIFYRKFGAPGASPLLLFHGGNYYDSSDWVEVATALSSDREVVAFDARGFGKSGWSSSKDYSHAAHMADAAGLLDNLGWKSAIVIGHSRGGAYALLFAARFPERTTGLVVVDYCPDFGIGPRGTPIVTTRSIGNKATVFPSSRAALASTSRLIYPDTDEKRCARDNSLLRQTADGFIIAKRDPDFANQIPTVASKFNELLVGDMWEELKNVQTPILVFRATDSKAGYRAEDVSRLQHDFPAIEVVDIASGHDVVAEAPGELIKRIVAWLPSQNVANANQGL